MKREGEEIDSKHDGRDGLRQNVRKRMGVCVGGWIEM